jgi:hypothetical protein
MDGWIRHVISAKRTRRENLAKRIAGAGMRMLNVQPTRSKGASSANSSESRLEPQPLITGYQEKLAQF